MIICIVSIIAFAIVGMINMDATIKKVVYLVFSLFILLAVLQSLGIWDSGTSMTISK
jgi:hypothetical protein